MISPLLVMKLKKLFILVSYLFTVSAAVIMNERRLILLSY
jgi:hypothetical protein